MVMATETQPSRRLLTVMAGYAKGSRLSPVTLRWIRALRQLSSQLVLVFDQDQLAGLEEITDQDPDVVCLCERHGAYDFGSYQRGLRLARERLWLDGASHVLLCNDSVVGPFCDLGSILEVMQQQRVPVWGLSDCLLYAPHLQSYFLLLDQAVVQQQQVVDFFESVIPQASRHDVIQAYELGFSLLLGHLGIPWRAWLPIGPMEDPRNGAPMGNSTAYPLCSLQAGSPVVKLRALKDYAANQDGLGRTCSLLAEQHPQIWAELWASTAHRRLWQEANPVAILLREADLGVLEERIAWIKAHPHPNLKALVAVPFEQIALRARLTRVFKQELENGVLGLLICERGQGPKQQLLQLLAAAGSDWIVVSSDDFWSDLSGLQLQLRRLAEQPQLRLLSGSPVLRRRADCFKAEVLTALLQEWADG